MLHAKFQDHRTLGSREEDFEDFTIYGHGSHLGHMTKTIFINLCPLFQEGSILKLACIGQVILEKKLENNGHMYIDSPAAGADIKT